MKGFARVLNSFYSKNSFLKSTIILVVLLLCLFNPSKNALAQTSRKRMPLVQAFEAAADPRGAKNDLIYEDIEFTAEGVESIINQYSGIENGNVGNFLRSKSALRSIIELTSDSSVILHRNLEFSNCKFPAFDVERISFKGFKIIHSQLINLGLNKIHAATISIGDNEVENFILFFNQLNVGEFNIYSPKGETMFLVQNSTFNYLRIGGVSSPSVSFDFKRCVFEKGMVDNNVIDLTLKNQAPIKIDSFENKYNSPFLLNRIVFDASTVDDGLLRINDCKFRNEVNQLSIAKFGSFKELYLHDIVSEGLLQFIDSRPATIEIQGSDLTFVDLTDLRFDKESATIDWDDIKGKKLCKLNSFTLPDSSSMSTYYSHLENEEMLLPTEYYSINKANSHYDLSFTSDYKDLYASYQNLYDYLKSKGDLESANECYIEMKDILTNRLQYLYQEDKSFKTFFRWRLAELIKFYTNHGTDPARAMIVSLWVIIGFGVFYFFFPSDWDVASKSRLIENYKLFVEKNEHGYWRPFLSLLLGFIVSLINALTLSLNSFTTLGFGNIPTHGLARYICVFQGFIGWFLLSIFTVALINQSLG